MKRAPLVALALGLFAGFAFAGPRPRATMTVTPTTTVTHTFSDVDGVLMQCLYSGNGGAVWYRTFTEAELAAQDGGLQADGGHFGVLADFRVQTDPMPIIRSSGQVAIGFQGISDAGTQACYLSTP